MTKGKPPATRQHQAPRRGEPQSRGGQSDQPVAREKCTFVGTCGASGLVAKLSGHSATLANLQNLGKCEIDVYCVESNGNEIANTRVTLKLSMALALYVAPTGTDEVRLKCHDAPQRESCGLSLLV